MADLTRDSGGAAVEVRLAAELQRSIFDPPRFPRDLRRSMERWAEEARPVEWKESGTPARNFERRALAEKHVPPTPEAS